MSEVATQPRTSVSISDHVAEVRLTRPDKHNALDMEMFAAINGAIDQVEEDKSVRAVVLCGDGPSFCAGLDLQSAMSNPEQVQETFHRRDGEIANDFQRVAYGWQQLPVPVIAALQRNALGGGCQIALGADIRIAAPDLRISVMEVKWGLIPDMGLSQSLPRLVGADVAKELVFTGRIVEAEEALELGLITKIADDPIAAAHELAAEIALKSPDAIRRSKHLLESIRDLDAREALELEEKLQRELMGSPNQIEAVRAGMMKEAPNFTDPE